MVLVVSLAVSVEACGSAPLPWTTVSTSEALGAVIRYALTTRGAETEGLINIELSESVTALIDSGRLRDSLQPWEINYGPVEQWMISGAEGCDCQGAAYVGGSPLLGRNMLTQKVAVVVPIGRAASYRITVGWRDRTWVLVKLEVLSTT